MIDNWDLHPSGREESTKTIRTYLEAPQWFAAGYLIPAGFTGWDEVWAKQVQEWAAEVSAKDLAAWRVAMVRCSATDMCGIGAVVLPLGRVSGHEEALLGVASAACSTIRPCCGKLKTSTTSFVALTATRHNLEVSVLMSLLLNICRAKG